MSTYDDDLTASGPATARPAVVDANGVIAEDITCRRCGYNLRGLSESGRCPECGTAVGLSIHGNLLRYADPAWVEKLARGIELILVSVAAGLILHCVIGAAGTRMGGGMSGNLGVIDAVVSIVIAVMSLAGVWILTTPDPSGIGEERFVNARKIVRFGLIVGLGSNLLALVLNELKLSGSAYVLVVLLVAACALVQAVATYAQYLYIERLAERIPNAKLVRLARFLRWGFGIVLAVSAVLSAIAMFFLVGAKRPTAGPGIVSAVSGMSVAIGLVGCTVGLALIVMSIACIVLYIRARQAFREQAKLARATWAAAAQGYPEVRGEE